MLFTDFVNFTQITEAIEPEDLVALLDLFFGEFDSIISDYGLEKIKTIGDSYMAAGGIPVRDKWSAVKTVKAAIDMQEAASRLVKRRAEFGLVNIDIKMRAGIHTGPVIAGVVGSKRFAFDLWGDTVNTASRFENASLPGMVNISSATYDKVSDYFQCEARGSVPIKNKADMEMYSIKGTVAGIDFQKLFEQQD